MLVGRARVGGDPLDPPTAAGRPEPRGQDGLLAHDRCLRREDVFVDPRETAPNDFAHVPRMVHSIECFEVTTNNGRIPSETGFTVVRPRRFELLTS